jgi:hypothetical protein
MRLTGRPDDLVGQVDGRDVQPTAGEVDADGLAGVGVYPRSGTASSPSSDQSSCGTVALTMRGVSAR